MNTDTETKPWPAIATRMEWSRILRIPREKLMYEEQRYRLTGTKQGYNVLYTRDQIIEWMRITGRI